MSKSLYFYDRYSDISKKKFEDIKRITPCPKDKGQITPCPKDKGQKDKQPSLKHYTEN